MPNCQALRYFVDSPRNAERRELFGPQSGATKDMVESLRVGEINGFAIYSIMDNVEYDEFATEPLYIKMIVVERKPDEFCEIYNDVDDVAVMKTVDPAYLMDLGSEMLLASKDQVSGNGGIKKEEYWAFDKYGPIFLDYLSLLDQTMQRLLPRGSFVPRESASFDMKTLSFESPVGKEGDSLSGASNGSVSIHFALRNHQLAVDNQEYAPPTPQAQSR